MRCPIHHSMKFGLLLAAAVLVPACNGTLGNGSANGPLNNSGMPQTSFGGLQAATAGGASGQVILSWSPAVDGVGAGITYLVFQSNAGSGAEDMSGPLYTTTSGTGLVLNGLVSAAQYWFIVQARDGSGGTDGNSVERTVVVP